MERRSDPDLNQVLRGNRSSGPRAGTVVDARMTLALWLRAGRAQRGMSLEDVARITKIQIRILERLEAGKPDGLPADVFVRGFVRSFAKCVGLGEDEALKRYSDCSGAATQAPAAARAMVEAMGDLTPALGQAIARPAPAPAPAPTRQTRDIFIPDDFVLPSASQPIVVAAVEAAAAIEMPAEAAPAVEAPAVEAPVVETPVVEAQVAEAPAAPAKKKRGKRATAAGTGAPATAKPRKRKARMATGTPVEPTPVVDTKSDPSAVVDASTPSEVSTAPSSEASIALSDASVASPVDASTASSTSSPVEASDASADASIEIVVESEPSANVIDASNASDDLFAPRLTEYDPDDLFAPRPFEPEAASDAISASDGSTDAASSAIDAQATTLDADMVETFGDEPIATATWQPKMPPLAATTSVPWRRPGMTTSTAPVASLVAVIDDADPEGAERLLEERRSSGASQRRSFLPPILLDREDRSARQGGLTLAVIILLIAATLTLSYLMRRPSSSGDGVTQRDVATETSATLA